MRCFKSMPQDRGEMAKKPKRRLMGVEPERLNEILRPYEPGEEIPDPAAASDPAASSQGSSPSGQGGQTGQSNPPGPTESLRPELGLAFEQAGQSIGRYKLLEKIGEGGFGVVYIAQQRYTGQRPSCLESHQAGEGLQTGHRPFRSRTSGPGHDGPS